jgi:hypothetical protein
MSVYLIAFIGAVFAGSINTLAGNGSAITLTVLTELIGLPGNMANGTNRVGVMMNGLGSSIGFYRGGRLDFKKGMPFFIMVMAGAIAGIIVATKVSNEQFMGIFKWLMIGMLLVLLVDPKRWLRTAYVKTKTNWWIHVPVFLAIGFYGGFIQMGMGIFYLAALVLLSKIPIIEANAIKGFTVFLYAIVAVAIFEWYGLIDWKIGLLMGVGQFMGSWLTARVASKYKGIEKWAYWMLVLAISLAILRLFDIF